MGDFAIVVALNVYDYYVKLNRLRLPIRRGVRYRFRYSYKYLVPIFPKEQHRKLYLDTNHTDNWTSCMQPRKSDPVTVNLIIFVKMSP